MKNKKYVEIQSTRCVKGTNKRIKKLLSKKRKKADWLREAVDEKMEKENK